LHIHPVIVAAQFNTVLITPPVLEGEALCAAASDESAVASFVSDPVMHCFTRVTTSVPENPSAAPLANSAHLFWKVAVYWNEFSFFYVFFYILNLLILIYSKD